MLAPFSEVWTYSTRCRRASSASGPNARMVRSNRMSSVASVRMSRLLVSKVFLAEFSISPRTSAVITTKRLATSPTTLCVSSCRCSEGNLILLKSPRRAAPIMDRKASTATTNSLIFFSFHVIRAVGCGHDAAALERQGILYSDHNVNRLGPGRHNGVKTQDPAAAALTDALCRFSRRQLGNLRPHLVRLPVRGWWPPFVRVALRHLPRREFGLLPALERKAHVPLSPVRPMAR